MRSEIPEEYEKSARKYKKVRSSFPKHVEMEEWGEDVYLTFFNFCDLFFERTDSGQVRISVRREKWKEIEKFLETDSSHNEWLWRINRFSWDYPSPTHFYKRLVVLINFILIHVRRNPSIVTPNMRKVMEPNPRLAKALLQYEKITTTTGLSYVGKGADIIPYEVQYANAITSATNLLQRLIDSIDTGNLKNMKLTTRASLIGKLATVLSVGSRFRPSKAVFKQLNLYGSSVEDLERSMLELNEE